MIFDALHAVDTSVTVVADDLETARANRVKGFAFDTCPWRTLRRSLRLSSIEAEGFTFVDIGCGKGKVLLSAMVLPFRCIVGVEFSPYLSRIAEQNVTSARLLARRCSDVKVICTDAMDYSIPEEPTIFFFYNPFGYEITEAVLDNIATSYSAAPRPIFLLFYGMSSQMPRIWERLASTSGGDARWLISTMIGSGSINIFELPRAGH